MKAIALGLVLCTIAGAAVAQTSTCQSRADDKKLAGAALTSFMKKCKKDAMKSCDANAIDKNLSGAARTSFTKKCVNDAVGG
jgi:psiF repeat